MHPLLKGKIANVIQEVRKNATKGQRKEEAFNLLKSKGLFRVLKVEYVTFWIQKKSWFMYQLLNSLVAEKIHLEK